MAEPVTCDCMSSLKASQKQDKTKPKQNTARPNMHMGVWSRILDPWLESEDSGEDIFLPLNGRHSYWLNQTIHFFLEDVLEEIHLILFRM